MKISRERKEKHLLDNTPQGKKLMMMGVTM